MNTDQLFAEIGNRGVEVVVVDGRLRVAPGTALTPELTAALRAHKRELLDLLSWPVECCNPERGRVWITERLYSSVGKTVETPQGRGRLIAALPELVAVDLHRQRCRAVFLPCEVVPLAAQRTGDPRR